MAKIKPIGKPILFSPQMIQALMAGTKIQTRRKVKPRPKESTNSRGEPITIFKQRLGGKGVWILPEFKDIIISENPFGQQGDLLWVRENFARDSTLTGYRYPATDDIHDLRPIQPSIFMPRNASRITLEIAEVKLERLHEISDVDCVREGIPWERGGHQPVRGKFITNLNMKFHRLWEQVNGAGSWNDNLWVWVITFKVHYCNINNFKKGQ